MSTTTTADINRRRRGDNSDDEDDDEDDDEEDDDDNNDNNILTWMVREKGRSANGSLLGNLWETLAGDASKGAATASYATTASFSIEA